MDVRLPNGTIIRGVPEGTSKDEVMRKAIASGIAKPEDFGQSATDSSGEPSLSMTEAPVQRPQQAEPSFADKALGVGEALLTTATGATAGAAGGAIGALEGVFEAVKQGKLGTSEAQQIIESQIAERMSQGTYQPRTETGQDYVQAIGEVAGALPAASSLVPEAAMAAQSARATAGLAGNVARSALPQALPQAKPQAMGGLSVGAAEIPIEQVRTQQAQELPVPIQLTKGQAAKDFEQQRFERETAKMNDIGDPIRQRYTEQNLQLQQNLDSFIDATGTTLPETSFMLETGQLIDKAIRSKAAQDKARIRSAYKEAEKAGELNNPVDLSDLAAYINENRAGRTSAPILNTIADEILVQEVGSGRIDDGSLQIGDITLGQAEKLRQSINKFAKDTDPNDLRVASELKQIIDQSTENAGGDIYRRARTLRRQYADQYENIGIIRDILGKKRGSDDRRIATENIVNKVVFSGSVDDLNSVRKTLQTQGAEGMAAWKEMQAATLRQIRDEATKNMARDQNGNPIVSAAGLNRIVTSLDKNGKLEKLYGKKGAEQIKLLNDVAKDILISQPGTVNSSNTSTALLAVLEMGAYGGPFVSAMKFARDKVKDRAVKKRVEQALANQEVKK
jgi:hypothetical protein